MADTITGNYFCPPPGEFPGHYGFTAAYPTGQPYNQWLSTLGRFNGSSQLILPHPGLILLSMIITGRLFGLQPIIPDSYVNLKRHRQFHRMLHFLLNHLI